jgi:hypothetical protein
VKFSLDLSKPPLVSISGSQLAMIELTRTCLNAFQKICGQFTLGLVIRARDIVSPALKSCDGCS